MKKQDIKTHFTEYFEVERDILEKIGAFNISIINDLPLFIDPFLLFNSKKTEYQELHNGIIKYLRFLRDKSVSRTIAIGGLYSWFTFPEIKQNWLGYSETGNSGHGLGHDFAIALNRNLNRIFTSFGNETITRSSHLEKLCLLNDGIGRDNISDFTTNLIKDYLLNYSQEIAKKYLPLKLTKRVRIQKVRFNYQTETWEPDYFQLPYLFDDWVILTPKELLTKDDTWINRSDLVNDYDEIIESIPNSQLRFQLNTYLLKHLPDDPTPRERQEVIRRAILDYPEFIEYYIKYKEEYGDNAESISHQKVAEVQTIFVDKVREFVDQLQTNTRFYSHYINTKSEALKRVMFLKEVIENRGGFHYFYNDRKPIRREKDLHILFLLTWCATPSDVSTEVNDGRGPADFKISRGSLDKTIVEFKLASNPSLARNLQSQVELYQKASNAKTGLKVIIYFTENEFDRVNKILEDLKLRGNKNIILIDARSDNKPSASKA